LILGCALAPLLNLLAENLNINPMIFYAGLVFFGSFLSLYLPESLNSKGASEIEEI
jgi:hypothetical protein